MMKIISIFILLFSLSAFAKDFHIQEGECKISFPMNPHHIREKLNTNREKSLEYDAYVSADEKARVFMMLIAKFPVEIKDEKIESSLEGFLSGLTAQSENQLVFAHLIEEEGNKVLEFSLESQGVTFRGRAFIKKSKLFVLAIESPVAKFDEESYWRFVKSFRFVKKEK